MTTISWFKPHSTLTLTTLSPSLSWSKWWGYRSAPSTYYCRTSPSFLTVCLEQKHGWATQQQKSFIWNKKG